MKNTYVEINLKKLINNYNVVKNLSRDKKIMSVVKANAYGHGSIEVSRVLIEQGTDYLAVATFEEAIVLRNEFKDIPILILGIVFENEIKKAIENNITLTIGNIRNANLIDKCAKELNLKAKVHIGVDTGMRRIGIQADETINNALEEIQLILNMQNLLIEGIFTHFASSDAEDLTYMNYQYNQFEQIVRECGYKFKYIHCSNSAAIEFFNNSLFNMVRPGLILYGYSARENSDIQELLEPILNWHCRITNIKKVNPNLSIGYSQKYFTKEESIIATIPIGYADGYNRLLSNNGVVYIQNVPCRVVGNVCMDQTMIDITEIADKCLEGDYVTIISKNYNASNIANQCGTIPYEILCGISLRVHRKYIK